MKIITGRILFLLSFFYASIFNFSCSNSTTQKVPTTQEIHNPTTDEYVQSGGEKTKANDYNGAMIDFSKAIELSPTNSIAYALRNAKIYLNDFTGALQDCNKAIEINPNNSDAFTSRGSVKLMSKDYLGAKEDYSKALALDPTNTDVYFSLGSAEFVLKD